MRRCAALLHDMLQHEGVCAAVMETGGDPVVYGEIEGERDDVTVVLYNHYDVKPVEPLEAWHSSRSALSFAVGAWKIRPPIVPDWRALSPTELRSCLVYARGNGDDKGPLYGNLMALRTMRAVAGKPPCRIKFLLMARKKLARPTCQHFCASIGSIAVVTSWSSPMAPCTPAAAQPYR